MPEVQLLAELPGHTDRVWSISWHPTLPLFASCSGDKSVRLWKLDEGNGSWGCVSTLDDAHKRTIRSVAFSPDGKLLATASFDASTAIWERDIDKWDCVATLEGHENEVKSVSWSASGALLATCSRDKSVWIWEVVGDSDFECLSVLQEHEQDVKMVQWHPNEELLVSASYDDTMKIWREDDDDWYCSDTLKGHGSTVWGVDFNDTGDLLASVSDDRTLRFWQRETPPRPDPATLSFQPRQDPKWRNIFTIPEHHDRTIYCVSWSKVHGRVVTAGADNKVKILESMAANDGITNGDDSTTPQFATVATITDSHGHSDINCVKWCPLKENGYGDLLATGGDDGAVRVWRFVT
ncbi:WD40-repeat-containing domain protein [Fimicolochytrium jonesii]|uniref:WD40-repeat-containing domain protein n=1 Tax=Fimicolochytrium jonesii TaxID=1396493 RepID=UPI0022FEB8AF|nr:WD40-repeat-containing domain protein [Fimicolochytrium jonesii]KAI8821138.1 WD40-repeat-containing domain protein [Fimicolochytrium jonesii]